MLVQAWTLAFLCSRLSYLGLLYTIYQLSFGMSLQAGKSVRTNELHMLVTDRSGVVSLPAGHSSSDVVFGQ